MQVDETCVDPLYNAANFKIISVTDETSPTRHVKVLAQFAGTPYQIAIYLPPAAAWQGRFFQHIYSVQPVEAAPDNVAFALASGGYLVNTNGLATCGCAGYRVDAAAAKMARAYAARYYGTQRRIRGYVWGGSGGSFQVLGAMENTRGVWDGAVPYVIANEASFLNYQAITALVNVALADKLAAMSDAVAPGGSGRPEQTLDAEQRAIYAEALQMGIPPRGFEYYANPINALLGQAGQAPTAANAFISGVHDLAESVRVADPGYVEDFWHLPGYEGANPPRYLTKAKVDETVTIRSVEAGPTGVPIALVLDHAPRLGSIGASGLEAWPAATDGRMRAGRLLRGEWSADTTRFTLTAGNDATLLASLKPGTTIRANNLFQLALLYYHRHSLPRDPSFYTYAQYRNADGSPRLPQRAFSAGRDAMVRTGGGGTQTGRITGKIIIVGNLLDISAFPYDADWYAGQVRRGLGERAYAANVRVWYNDNANHIDRPPTGDDRARLVTYVPTLFQALRDLSAWVETGTPPPPSTRYRIEGGQVVVPHGAAERGGIQPVVDLTAAGAKRIDTAPGRTIRLEGRIAVPPGTGRIVATQWYLGGQEIAFTTDPLSAPRQALTVSRDISFRRPGTYFVTLRALSQRDGNLGDPATLQNVDRVRVVVR